MSTATDFSTPAKAISLGVLAGFVTYGVVRAVQMIYLLPPNVPQPDITPCDRDGAVMGLIKRSLFRHFYVIRRGEHMFDLHAWCEQYQYKPFMMKIFLRPHIVVSNPEDVQDILLRQENIFYKGAGYDLVRSIIGDGLLAVGDKYKHAMHRRILGPIFSSNNIRGMSNEVTRLHALRMIGNLFESLQRAGDEDLTVDISSVINRMALGAIGEAAFRASREESVQVRSAFDTLTSLCKMNYFCPYLKTRTQQEARQMVGDICDMLLDKNLTLRQPSSRRVVMDALIDELYKNFDKQDVVNHVVTFLFAGHDTTSHTLQFLFALLGSSPQVQERLFEALEEIMPSTCSCPTVEELQNCEYLVAVAKEVLRLYPAAPILYRDAAEDAYLPSDVAVPKGMTAVISIFSLHRNKNLYGEDANVFRPERWIGEEGEQLRQRCGRCGYIPFSCGRRNCIGQEFGYMEILITTALMVRHLHLELVGKFPTTRYNITLTSKDPVHLRVRAREDAPVDLVYDRINKSLHLSDEEEEVVSVRPDGVVVRDVQNPTISVRG